MTDNLFDHTVYLNDLYEKLSDLCEQPELDDFLSVEFDGTYLHITAEEKEYLIHWHNVQNQVWLSSPKSGAHHFEWSSDQRLCSTRNPTLILEQLLEQELGISL